MLLDIRAAARVCAAATLAAAAGAPDRNGGRAASRALAPGRRSGDRPDEQSGDPRGSCARPRGRVRADPSARLGRSRRLLGSVEHPEQPERRARRQQHLPARAEHSLPRQARDSPAASAGDEARAMAHERRRRGARRRGGGQARVLEPVAGAPARRGLRAPATAGRALRAGGRADATRPAARRRPTCCGRRSS